MFVTVGADLPLSAKQGVFPRQNFSSRITGAGSRSSLTRAGLSFEKSIVHWFVDQRINSFAMIWMICFEELCAKLEALLEHGCL
jgi:hypothetical protein